MDRLSLLLPPRVLGPSLPLAVAPSNSRRLSGTSLVQRRAARFSVSAVAAETPRTEEAPSPSPSGAEGFDWLDQWYPLAPVCDLDPRAPHGKTVLGLSVVAWYDRGAGEWRVFDDACPHRLAPLSEGRVDDKGRLQCVYHGWCFDGAGACKFIPQAPALGPPVRITHFTSPPRQLFFAAAYSNRDSCRRCTRTERRAWRRTPAWCRTTSSGSTRDPT
jgi:nitrite reductase/ring-hydroxylating ferredoxin subunit